MCGRREVGVYEELSEVGLQSDGESYDSPVPRDFRAGPCRPKIFDPESKELFFFCPYYLAYNILVTQPGEFMPLAMKEQSPSHWTDREFPG